ncbi:MAG: helix-turn-helix domain-containing protein [Polyangiaceae bacterium]|jgi:transcriptional regulator with XRE-family HTH domain|nr:helix-turn-helix domain-containing protein [Polyangiaceae bacterium]
MPREKSPSPPEGHFGLRLADLRRAAGLSQTDLQNATGISRRMIAHYEGRPALPPGHVLAALADGLGTSVDELVGKKPARPSGTKTQASRRLLRRLQQLEKLPLKDKRELLGIIDTYLERHRLLQKAS